MQKKPEALEKTLMLGKIGGNRKRSRQKTRWLDTITDVTEKNIQELEEMITDRKAWLANVRMDGKRKKRTTLKGKMSKMKTAKAETIQTPKTRRHGNECRLK